MTEDRRRGQRPAAGADPEGWSAVIRAAPKAGGPQPAFALAAAAPRAPAAARFGRIRYPRATGLAALVALLALLPLGFLIAASIGVGPGEAARLIVRPRVGELAVNTALLEVLTVPAAALLALALAWLTERTDLPAARLFALLAAAPLAIPAFVQSYAWTGTFPGFHGLLPAVLVSVLAYFPFLYLPVAAQLRRLDPGLEDTAASLGLGPWQVFFRAVLPQLRVALAGGALLVALHLLAEFGLYGMIRLDTFTTAIMDELQSSYAGPAAYMLAAVLVLSCFGLLALEAIARGGARYARVGAGAPRPTQRRALGRAVVPALALAIATAALALGVPLLTVGRWLLRGGAGVWEAPALFGALGVTVALALAGAVLTTVAAYPMAWLSVRAPGRLQRLLEAGHYYVGSLPGVVVALALVAITVHTLRPLYQTGFTVLFAYSLMFLPRALTGLRASLAQAPVELEWAAMALGRPPLRASAVTMRLAAPGIAASMVLVALAVAMELTATLLLAPTGTHTLATEFWALTGELDYDAAAPYALLMVLASLPLTFILHAQSRRVTGR